MQFPFSYWKSSAAPSLYATIAESGRHSTLDPTYPVTVLTPGLIGGVYYPVGPASIPVVAGNNVFTEQSITIIKVVPITFTTQNIPENNNFVPGSYRSDTGGAVVWSTTFSGSAVRDLTGTPPVVPTQNSDFAVITGSGAVNGNVPILSGGVFSTPSVYVYNRVNAQGTRTLTTRFTLVAGTVDGVTIDGTTGGYFERTDNIEDTNTVVTSDVNLLLDIVSTNSGTATSGTSPGSINNEPVFFAIPSVDIGDTYPYTDPISSVRIFRPSTGALLFITDVNLTNTSSGGSLDMAFKILADIPGYGETTLFSQAVTGGAGSVSVFLYIPVNSPIWGPDATGIDPNGSVLRFVVDGAYNPSGYATIDYYTYSAQLTKTADAMVALDSVYTYGSSAPLTPYSWNGVSGSVAYDSFNYPSILSNISIYYSSGAYYADINLMMYGNIGTIPVTATAGPTGMIFSGSGYCSRDGQGNSGSFLWTVYGSAA